jgi:hypothetical protein
MTRIGLGALAAISLSALAACSGGGAAPTATPKAPTATPTPTTQNVAKASGTLTIKFSHIKEHLVAGKSKNGTVTGRRSPKFIDPQGTFLVVASYGVCSQTTLGIYSPSTLTWVPISSQNAQPDGTQVATVPIVADGCSTIVYAYEVNDATEPSPLVFPSYPNGTSGDILAFGEGLTSGSPQAGSSGNAVSITMEVAPYALGFSYAPQNGSSATTLGGPNASDAATFDLENYGNSSSQYDSDGSAYVVAGDYDMAVDDCYFNVGSPGTGSSSSMPAITLAEQYSDNGGQSKIDQLPNGAWVYYADADNNDVFANFTSGIGAFPTDGPYSSANVPNPAAPIFTAQNFSGWVDIYCSGNCNGQDD